MSFFEHVGNLKKFAGLKNCEVELELSTLLSRGFDMQKLEHVSRTVVKRLQQLVSITEKSFERREKEASAVVAGLAAGVSVVLLGPPGTAKSALVRRVAFLCGLSGLDGRFFEYLLTNHTMPEEIFGGPDLEQLTKGKVARITRGKLPEAEVAFLDELFRGGSHILNTLLTIINEKRYDSGDGSRHVPLLGLIGAANSAPLDPDLEAFFDRFPVRVWVESVLEPRNRFESYDEKAAGRLAGHSIHSEITRLKHGWNENAAKEAVCTEMVTCTNDLRLARIYLLSRLQALKNDSERFSQFERLFRSVRERCRLSDRSFGQLWLFGSALDFIRGADPVLPYPASTGHVDVFRNVGRSLRDVAFLHDRVEQLTRGTQHSGAL